MKSVIIVSPSLDAAHNVSGVSAVSNFIIKNNCHCKYYHFLQGKSDEEEGLLKKVKRLLTTFKRWNNTLKLYPEAIVHYNFPLDAKSIIRDFFFIELAFKKKRKMVIHIHGGLYLFKKDKPFIINILLKRIFKLDFPFIVLSKKEKEEMERVYQVKNISVLPNCVDLNEASLYNRSILDNRLEILYLGRIEPNKGIDYILKAAQVLKEDKIDFLLHFAGAEQNGDDYILKFKKALGDKFVYEGIVAGDVKIELLKKCNVFLLPSFYEGLPVSLLECMSFGMIPVTTNVGSIGNFVIDNETGLFVSVKDTESIVEALTRLSESSDLRNQLSKNAREKIFTTLDPQKYVDNLNGIYERACGCTSHT